MKKLPDLSAVVTLDEQDRILVIRRSKNNSRAGDWESPLGHRDSGESPTTAAHREVKEETGLAVSLFPATFDKTLPDGRVLRWFLGRVKGDATVTLNPLEHDQHRWVPWNKLDSVKDCHPSFFKDVAKVIRLNGETVKEGAISMLPQRNPLPGPLMNNQYAAMFPVGRALPEKPNPLSATQPAAGVKADAAGVQQALAKRAEACGSTSAAGEGKKKYKIRAADQAQGAEAFDSLDEYMKRAGLNSFQASFFGRLIREGFSQSQIKSAVDAASLQLGEAVAAELNSGFEKVSFGLTRLAPAIGRGIGRVGKLFGRGAANVADDAAGVARKALAGGADDVASVAGKALAGGADDVAAQAAKGVTPPTLMGQQVQSLKPRATRARSTPTPAAAPAATAPATAANVATAANPPRRLTVEDLKKYTGVDTLNPLAAPAQVARMARSGDLGAAMQTVKQRGITGALTSLANPYTGVGTEDLWNPEASLSENLGNLGDVAKRQGLQALAGGALSQLGGRGIQNLQRRMIAGAGIGGGLGLVGDVAGAATGIEGLQGWGDTLAHAGFLGGAALPARAPGAFSKIPGLGVTKGMRASGGYGNVPPGYLDKLDPNYWAMRGLGKTLQAAKPVINSPTTRNLGLLGAAGATGVAANKIPQIMQQSSDAMQQQLADQGYALQQQFADEGQRLRDTLQQQLAPVRQVGESVQGLFGGGGANAGNAAGGNNFITNLGQSFANNKQWLLPLLLGGLGAGGGYAAGGGGGAALGGLALPLIYMLMQNPQMLQALQGQQQQAAANTASTIPKGPGGGETVLGGGSS